MGKDFYARTYKENISEFNREELRGWIIDSMNFIEGKIDEVIISFFKPEDPKKFKKIMLNSSIINTGAKLKVLKNIKDFESSIITKLQDMSSIRNFLHTFQLDLCLN